MRPTLSYFEDKFDYYNNLCFGGSLKRPPISLSMSYQFLGVTKYRLHRHADKVVENISIEFSVRHDLPEIEYIDTILHEMIHYYIAVNHIKDDAPHGTIFKKMMTEITEKYGIRITIAFNPTDEYLVSTESYKMRYICILEFTNGTIGGTVVARNRVWDLWNVFENDENIKSSTWYVSNRAIFEKFPMTISGRYVVLTEEQVQHYLTGALQLEKYDNIIRPIIYA